MPIVPEDLGKLGLTPPGWEWRPGQRELAEQVAASKKKIVMLEAECGTGKSLIPLAAARALGRSAIVLIQTIQLQEQYLKDLKGLVTMTGRVHDRCNIRPQLTAAEAPCTIGVACGLKGQWSRTGVPITTPECFYFKRKAAAALAPASVQNYAYWLNETRSASSAFQRRDWIICDEGHELDQILMAEAAIEFPATLLRKAHITQEMVRDALRAAEKSGKLDWGEQIWKLVSEFEETAVKGAEAHGLSVGTDLRLKSSLDEIPDDDLQRCYPAIEQLGAARRIRDTLAEAAASFSAEEWVVCPPDAGMKNWSVRPIYGKYGFKRIVEAANEKVVIMSAYLAPKLLMKNLGLTEDDVDVIIAPKVFDRSRSPVIYAPITKLSHKMLPQLRDFYFSMVDEIIDQFGETKGVIHVPSVAMRDDFLMKSRHRKRFICYDGVGSFSRRFPSKDEAIEQFVRTSEPKILLGQSISTGLDLPGVFKWQIIAKLAFAPTNDPVIAARKARDKHFYPYHTICQVVQAAGRAKRSPEYDAVTVIVDEQFGWFYASQRENFPQWFRDSLQMKGWGRLPKAQAAMPKVAMATGVRL